MKYFKDSDKKIGISNYILIIIIFTTIIISVIVLRNIYLAREDMELKELVLNDVLPNQLRLDELNNYIDEVPDTLLYVGVSGDKKSKKFENNIKKYIINNDLSNDITYLNLSIDETKRFFDNINYNYDYDSKIDKYPLVIYFKNGDIDDVLQNNINKEKFIKFVDKIGYE